MIDRASLFTDQRISGLPIRPKFQHFRTIWEHTFDNFSTDFISSFFEVVVIDAGSQTFVARSCPFCDRTSKFVDHKMSNMPIRAKYRHFRTICGQTIDNAPRDPFSYSSKWWSSKHGVKNCSIVSRVSSQYLSTHFFARPSMSWRYNICLKFPWSLTFWYFSMASAEILDSNILLPLSTILAYYLAFSSTAIHTHMAKERCWLFQINVFHLYFPCWTDVLLLSNQFYIVHIHR